MTNEIVSSEPIYSSLAADPLMGELVEMYVEENPQRIDALQEAFASGDRQALRRTAHQMKGAAGSYGFDALTASAAALEAAIREEQSADSIRRLFDELIELCRRIRAGTATRTL